MNITILVGADGVFIVPFKRRMNERKRGDRRDDRERREEKRREIDRGEGEQRRKERGREGRGREGERARDYDILIRHCAGLVFLALSAFDI